MYEQLEKKLEETKALRWHKGHGAEQSWILEAEAELGFQLPPSYKWWLENYNNGYLNGGNILGLAPTEHRDYADNDILYIHRLNIEDEEWCEQFPHRVDLYVPDSDELYFFDTSQVNEQGEFEIKCFDLMNGIIDTFAHSFAEFLENLLDHYRTYN